MARVAPSVTYANPGDLCTAGLWDTNGPKALNDFLSNRPAFVARGNANQSIPNNAWTAVQFALNLLDTDGGHNVVSNNTRYTCQVAGWYWVKGSFSINPTGAGNGVSRMDTAIAVNGSIYIGSVQMLTKGANINSAQQASTILYMPVGNYVELWVRQATGVTITADVGFGIESGFMTHWLSN